MARLVDFLRVQGADSGDLETSMRAIVSSYEEFGIPADAEAGEGIELIDSTLAHLAEQPERLDPTARAEFEECLKAMRAELLTRPRN